MGGKQSMLRPTKDEYYLGIAKAVAMKSTCLRKHYGAIIVKDDRILSTGYNGAPVGEPHCEVCTKVKSNKDMEEYLHCPACHAEMNCIIQAARKDMIGATLYLVGVNPSSGAEMSVVEPCQICLRLIKNAGIDKVVTRQGILYERDENGILQKKIN